MDTIQLGKDKGRGDEMNADGEVEDDVSGITNVDKDLPYNNAHDKLQSADIVSDTNDVST